MILYVQKFWVLFNFQFVFWIINYFRLFGIIQVGFKSAFRPVCNIIQRASTEICEKTRLMSQFQFDANLREYHELRKFLEPICEEGDASVDKLKAHIIPKIKEAAQDLARNLNRSLSALGETMVSKVGICTNFMMKTLFIRLRNYSRVIGWWHSYSCGLW